MPLDGLTMDEAVQRVVSGLDRREGGVVLTPNLDVLRQHRRSRRLQQVFEDTELLVADGVPLVWASRLQGTPVPQRITGSDMLWSVAAMAASRGDLLFLAGGRPGVPQRAADHLVGVHPGLRALAQDCFVEPGPLAPQVKDLVSSIVSAAPDVVYVGLPFASQVELIAELRSRLPGTWFLGIGSCFDFVNGDRPRAPVWLQRLGLEWAHRLVYEPRVWRRYLVQGLPFATHLGLHALRVRATRRRAQRI